MVFSKIKKVLSIDVFFHLNNMTKRIYNSWKKEDMDEALLKHRNGKIRFNEACRTNTLAYNMASFHGFVKEEKLEDLMI